MNCLTKVSLMATKATLFDDQKRMFTFAAAGGAEVGLPAAGWAGAAGAPQAAKTVPPTATLAMRKKSRRDNDLDIFPPHQVCELGFLEYPARVIKISCFTSFLPDPG
jgi:hypothetical protein